MSINPARQGPLDWSEMANQIRNGPPEKPYDHPDIQRPLESCYRDLLSVLMRLMNPEFFQQLNQLKVQNGINKST